MSANTSAICTVFKVGILNGTYVLGTGSPDTIKAALYLTDESIGAGTTEYSSTGEVSGTNYTAGGATVTNATAPTSSGTTAYWTPSANISWSDVTLSTAFDTVLLYDSSKSNAAILAYNFGSTTVTAGTLTLTMPSNTSTTALIQLN